MKPLVALLVFLACLVAGCETTTTSVNDGFGVDFNEDANADQAKVID